MTKVLVDISLIEEAINQLPDTLGNSTFSLRHKLRRAIEDSKEISSVEQQVELLKQWQDAITAVDAEVDKVMEVLRIDPECPLFESIWKLQDVYTQYLSDKLGLGDWIYWYQYDNEMGKKGHEAGVVGNLRSIKSFEDLIWVAKLEAK